jgi:hypothetical protein
MTIISACYKKAQRLRAPKKGSHPSFSPGTNGLRDNSVEHFYRSEEKLELSRNFGNDYAERQALYGKEWLPRYVRLTTSELALFDLAYQALKKYSKPFRCVVLEIKNTTDHLEEYITQKEGAQ